MTKNSFTSTYWKYYLSLEAEFLWLEEIIPISKINENTYSLKYMKLMFSICSEIDNLFKIFIEFTSEQKLSNNGNICQYFKIIDNANPNFKNEIIEFNSMEIHPFIDWKNSHKLPWWMAYNLLKHKRIFNNENNLFNASQKNVILSLAALYQLEMYFLKSILLKTKFNGKLKMPVPHSKYFRIKDWEYNVNLIDNRYILNIDKSSGHLIFEGV